MKIPKALKKGDRVAIIATARKVNPKDLNPALRLLESWELIPVLGSSIGLSSHQFAGTDEQRAQDLQKQLNDPKVRAIWCAKGGYGTVRLLDLVDFTAFQQDPKWLIGYSDITALHSHLNKLKVASLHAQICLGIETKTPNTQASLKQLLFAKNWCYTFNGHSQNKPGTAKGILVGGNLSVLFSLIGSRSDLDLQHKILFIEDLDEYLYHIDRMLQNLKRNGWFNKISGLIVGGMSDMNDNTIPFGQNALEIIQEAVAPYDFPVAYNFPAGHLEENQAIALGKKVQLDVSRHQSELKYI
ncbi:LD-carboxypeptidase [Mesonia sediminis]|uniref:LD-carboxypeptidase n=1 Tax=Mesonia sediminis TaxID=1703946 RepID=A0ABW5SEM7_9FLAO